MIHWLQLPTLFFACAFSILLVIPSLASAGEAPASASCCQPSDLMELPQDAVEKMKIDAGFGWGIFSGTIYNGNANYHITQLIVSMTPIHGHHHGDMHSSMSHEPKEHRISLDVAPQSKGALSMPLPNEDNHIHDFDWKILKVMGYRVR